MNRRKTASATHRLRAYMLAILLVCCTLLITYRLTAPPGITWSRGGIDGAELTLVSDQFGVAHPPGYALYTTLGWLALRLPLGSAYVRMEWLNHLIALAACAVIGWCAWAASPSLERRQREAAALSAAAALGVSRTFWSQAIMVEVYGFHVLLFCAMLGLTLRIRRVPSPLALIVFGHVAGLAITHHLTALLWLPAFLILLRGRDLRHWGWIALGGVTGLYPLALLVARAGIAPAANWGGIELGLPALWDHLTGRIYAGYLQPVSLELALRGIGDALAMLARDFAWIGVIPLAVGVLRLARERRDWIAAGVLWLVLLGGFTGLYSAADTPEPYRLPLSAAAALLVGIGVARLRGKWLRFAPALVAAVLLIANWGAVDLRGDEGAAHWIAAAEAEIPLESIVITTTTEATFTLWYAHFVEGVRGDWVIIDRDLWRFEWYRRNLARLYPHLPPPEGSLESWLRSPEMAALPIASEGFIAPPPGRRSSRAGVWYVVQAGA